MCNSYLMADEFPPESEIELTNPPAPDSDDAPYQTLAHGYLSPRHRRLCFLAAQGRSNAEIGKELDYVDSRVSVLLKNPFIKAEITKLQERIYEETIGARIKTFAEPALNVIQAALTDQTNRVKMSEKLDVAKWVIEKIDGKATQKIEAGENLLASLMDRLDAAKTAGRPVINNHIHIGQSKTEESIDVTPQHKQLDAPKSEEDDLEDWVVEFTAPASIK